MKFIIRAVRRELLVYEIEASSEAHAEQEFARDPKSATLVDRMLIDSEIHICRETHHSGSHSCSAHKFPQTKESH